MKRIIFFAAVFAGILFFKPAQAQVSYDLDIKSQPQWGPVGFDHVDYYYLPDIDCWYDVPHHQFIYEENKKWVKSPSLPPAKKNYDLYKGYKVVVNQPVPYLDDRYRKSYAKYKGRKSQRVIRDSHEAKYKNGGITPTIPTVHSNVPPAIKPETHYADKPDHH